jgi:hypothetical protein
VSRRARAWVLAGEHGSRVGSRWLAGRADADHGSTDSGYAGVLNTEPRTQDALIGLGQHVEFGPNHIIDALPPENWNPRTREYDE